MVSTLLALLPVPLTQATYRSIRIHTLDELNLCQINDTTYTFRKPVAVQTALRASTIEKLKEWLCCIISSRAVLRLDPSGDDADRVYTVTRHPLVDAYEWRLCGPDSAIGTLISSKWTEIPSATAPTSITMTISGWGQPVAFYPTGEDPEVVSTCTNLQDVRVVLDGHPKLQHGPTLLATATRGRTAGSTLRTIAAGTLRGAVDSRVVGLEKLVARLDRQSRINPILSEGLLKGTPGRLTRQPWGVTAQQQLCKYRLAIGGLNLRDQSGDVIQCPHAYCSSTAPPTETHVFWDCVGARRYWRSLLARWTGLGEDTVGADYASAIFGMSAPPLATTHRRHLEELTASTRSIASMITRVWTVIVHASLQQLWLCRNAAAFHDVDLPLPGLAATVDAAVTNQLRALGTAQRRHSASTVAGSLVDGLLLCLERRVTTEQPPGAKVRLYFDGGARQNPGPAGAGCLIVERAGLDNWAVVWWEAHYIGDTATNNIAEHTALSRGVQECVSRYGERSHVDIVGDSQLILSQIAGDARTTTHALRVIVEKTQHRLRDLDHYTLNHSLRAGNKMADRLANYAMDTRRTTCGPFDRDQLTTELTALLPHDIAHPWTTKASTATLLPQLRLLLEREQAHRSSRKRRRRQPD